MSNDVTTPDGEALTGPPTRGRRKLWVAAGVAGITGVVGLAALGGVAARDDSPGGSDRPDAQSNAQRAVSDAGRADDTGGEKGKDGADERSGSGKDDRRDHKGKAKEVPCLADKLIQAIVHANDNGGGVLELAKGCTYQLTRHERGNGLPVIKESIVLKGHDTKLVRAATAEHFRILNVGRGGHLTLKDLTIKGGQTRPVKMVPAPITGPTQDVAAPPAGRPAMAAPKPAVTTADGAGILVQRGGSADIKDSKIERNQSGGDGGGIANFGRTTLEHSTVSHNTAFATGGGIYNTGLLKVEESGVTYNNSSEGGGIANDGGTALVKKSTVSHNRAIDVAGGLATSGGSTTVIHSQVTDNTAAASAGGLRVTGGSELTLQHVAVARNATAGGGGGLLVAGSEATIEDSVVKENTAGGDGGGLESDNGRVTLRNSEVVANQAVGQNSRAGGIFNAGALSEVRLIRTKVAHNLATNKPGGIFTTHDTVVIDDKSAVKDNRPTNCKGSPVIPDNCFG